MKGTASCVNDHKWPVTRNSQQHFALTISPVNIPSRFGVKSDVEREFLPKECPTCGKLALRVKESKKK